MKFSILNSVLFVFLVSCGSLGAAQPDDVSLLRLIAMPQQFDGKFVRVIGFLRLEFEGTVLYLHEEDYKHGLFKNAVWVNYPFNTPAAKAIDKKYVIMEGIFDAKNHGHMGLSSGELHTITRADLWSDPQNPRAERDNSKPVSK